MHPYAAALDEQHLPAGSHSRSSKVPFEYEGTATRVTVAGVSGVAVGSLIRSTSGGIAVFVGLRLVLPGGMSILPQNWQDHLTPYLRTAAGGALYQIRVDAGTLAPWSGFGVFLAYAAVIVVAAGIMLVRRDA
jgi:ABC-2 type transport system permease protein